MVSSKNDSSEGELSSSDVDVDNLVVQLGHDVANYKSILQANQKAIGKTDDYGRTLLHALIEISDLAENNLVEIIKHLIKNYSIDINTIDNGDEYPLLMALKRRKYLVFKLLLGRPGIVTNCPYKEVDDDRRYLLDFVLKQRLYDFVPELFEKSYAQQGSRYKSHDGLSSEATQYICFGGEQRFKTLAYTILNQNIQLFEKLYNIAVKRSSGVINDNPLTKHNDQAENIIHIICKQGDLIALDIIENSALEEEKKIAAYNEEDNDGLTPVIYLIRNNQHQMLNLIRSRIEPNRINKNLAAKKFLEENEELKEAFFSSVKGFSNQDYQDVMVGILPEPNGVESGEGEALIHEAINADLETLLVVLNIPKLNLSLRDELGGLRAITYVLNQLKKDREEFKRTIEFQSKVQESLRGVKHTKNLNNHVSKVLLNHAKKDVEFLRYLKFLQWCSSKEIQGISLISLMFTFNFKQKRKKPLTPLTSHEFNNIIKNILQKITSELISSSSYSDTDEDAQKYLVLEAAQKAFKDEIPSDGEELDESVEEKQIAHADMLWNRIECRSDDLPVSQSFIPIFRGINFHRNLFTLEDRNHYEINLPKMTFFPSMATFDMLGEAPYKIDATEPALVQQGEPIRELFKELSKDDGVELFDGAFELMRGCKSFRHLIQRLYSEDYSGFSENIFNRIFAHKDKGKIKKRFPTFEIDIRNRILAKYRNFQKIFNKNCCVSGSLVPRHAIRYTLGVSRADANRDKILNPRYDKNGIPKYPRCGVINIALFSKEDYEAAAKAGSLFNFPQEYAQGNIGNPINVPSLLPETEITFVGYMDHIVLSLPIIYPPCTIEDEEAVCDKYNISRENRNKIFSSLREDGRKHNCYGLEALREKMIADYEIQFQRIAEALAKRYSGSLVFPMPNGEYLAGWHKPSKFRDHALKLKQAAPETRRAIIDDDAEYTELQNSKKDSKRQLVAQKDSVAKRQKTSNAREGFFSQYKNAKTVFKSGEMENASELFESTIGFFQKNKDQLSEDAKITQKREKINRYLKQCKS